MDQISAKRIEESSRTLALDVFVETVCVVYAVPKP